MSIQRIATEAIAKAMQRLLPMASAVETETTSQAEGALDTLAEAVKAAQETPNQQTVQAAEAASRTTEAALQKQEQKLWEQQK